MPTYRLLIEYQGTRYSGWQEQRNARTVAGELRGAIGRVAGRVIDLGGAGRTDAGVHAIGQVAHVRLETAVDPEPFRRAVNDLLPTDVHVLAAAPAPDTFHARHDALSRSYVYQVAVRRPTFTRRTAWWIRRALDPAAMAAEVPALVGRHDFAAFAERPGDHESTLVVVERAELEVEGALILFRIAASHFLWKMVRRIAGTLVKVGAGEWPAGAVGAILAGDLPPAEFGTIAENTAPPVGLFFERVLYPGDEALGPLVAPVPLASEPRLAPLAARGGPPAHRPREGGRRPR